jgi:hypothetical protein
VIGKIYEEAWTKHVQTTIAQMMPAQYGTNILQLHKLVTAAGKKSCFVLGQIFQILLTFDVPSNKTMDITHSTPTTIKTSGYKKIHTLLF